MREKKDNNHDIKNQNVDNELQIFSNEEFGEIRTLEIDGKPYFVASDIAKALGYKDSTNAIKQHCRWVVKHHIPHPQSESWVFDEVLPAIRKTGGYVNNVDLMVNTYFSDVPDEQKSLVKGLLVNIEEKQKKIVSLNNENDLLAQKNLEWADRPLINSLVRAYASSIGDFGKAWNNYKKELLYKHSININSRITNHINTTGKKPKTLNMIDDSELANAISVAVSLCRENNVEIDDLLNNKSD